MTRDPDILSAREVGHLLGLGRNAVYEGAARGEIPSRRVGRRVIFSRTALVLWLKSHVRGALAEELQSHAGVP